MSLIVLDLAFEMISDIRPLIERVSRRDRALADQLQRAASSVALNLAEGAQSGGGNRTTRFRTAAGSASETRAALRVAAAWGYISDPDRAQVDAKLDRVLAMLWRLCHRGS
jgi:four helix bundle protein